MEHLVLNGTVRLVVMFKISAKTIGLNLKKIRSLAGLTQTALARRSDVNRTQIVKIEAGKYTPQLDEAVRLVEALNAPLQKLLTGKTRPPVGLQGIALELHHFGIRDLAVSKASVPGAFRRPEEVVALAVRGERPEVRVIEALPYLLARHRLNVGLTIAFANLLDPRAKTRIAWLSDITLALNRKGTLQVSDEVERSLGKLTGSVKKPAEPDNLGHPGDTRSSPIWRRWNITYGSNLSAFEARALELAVHDVLDAEDE